VYVGPGQLVGGQEVRHVLCVEDAALRLTPVRPPLVEDVAVRGHDAGPLAPSIDGALDPGQDRDVLAVQGDAGIDLGLGVGGGAEDLGLLLDEFVLGMKENRFVRHDADAAPGCQLQRFEGEQDRHIAVDVAQQPQTAFLDQIGLVGAAAYFNVRQLGKDLGQAEVVAQAVASCHNGFGREARPNLTMEPTSRGMFQKTHITRSALRSPSSVPLVAAVSMKRTCSAMILASSRQRWPS
jgi:hypothetical protein